MLHAFPAVLPQKFLRRMWREVSITIYSFLLSACKALAIMPALRRQECLLLSRECQRPGYFSDGCSPKECWFCSEINDRAADNPNGGLSAPYGGGRVGAGGDLTEVETAVCCPPTTLAKLEPRPHLRSPMRAGGTSSAQPVPSPWARLGSSVPAAGGGSGPPGEHRARGMGGCAALASGSLFPQLHFQRGDSGGSDDAEQRWKEDRKPTGLLSPQWGTDPGGNSARAGQLSARLCPETAGQEPSWCAALGTTRPRSIPRHPRPPRNPSLACNPSGRGGQPETPGHPPTLSCGRGIGEGEEGGGGGGRAAAGRRGQPGLRCSRRPGTTDGGGKRGGREGGSEGGGRARRREEGREGRREGWREGRKEGDPPPFGSAAQRPLKEQKPLSLRPPLPAPRTAKSRRCPPASAGRSAFPPRRRPRSPNSPGSEYSRR